MDFEVADFSNAAEYFGGAGKGDWLEIESILHELRLQLQPSGQDGIVGEPNFDPKATNRILTNSASLLGWEKVPVPVDLKSAFGADWDAGKHATLVEWQFSNYPFLWNNIIRSQVAARNSLRLTGLTSPPEALIIVTKSGCLPASQSTLYFEQARAQVRIVSEALDLDIAIRLVGLNVPVGETSITADWNTYPDHRSRVVLGSTSRDFSVSWTRRSRAAYPIARIALR
ncbi:hypothetical protein [Kitasatospora sp. NPDC015120]|uniref:hypothetical protein n=1 Tax=Kitasatospora sp. NPDC015120 TaxID=3364023 RepID=UPI0036F4AC85